MESEAVCSPARAPSIAKLDLQTVKKSRPQTRPREEGATQIHLFPVSEKRWKGRKRGKETEKVNGREGGKTNASPREPRPSRRETEGVIRRDRPLYKFGNKVSEPAEKTKELSFRSGLNQNRHDEEVILYLHFLHRSY